MVLFTHHLQFCNFAALSFWLNEVVSTIFDIKYSKITTSFNKHFLWLEFSPHSLAVIKVKKM